MILITIIKESFRLAIHELSNNKLRSFLSLTGITIGILCIISVLSAVDSLETNVRNTINRMGSDVLYVEKWPWSFGGEYPWWKYLNLPEANYNDFKAIKEYSEKAERVAIQAILANKTIRYKNNFVEGVMLAGVTADYASIYNLKLDAGRYFSRKEDESGDPVVAMGYDIAEDLFRNPEHAPGHRLKALNSKLLATGVIEKEGQGIMGPGFDQIALVPYAFMQKFINENSRVFGQRIIVQAKEGVELPALKAELRKILRRVRKLNPKDEDNFAINEMSILTQGITQTFSIINLAGFFIGGFSILVGGFGIANIMFVSVKERTRIIGIKMAMGAKKIWILMEFLLESVVLSLIGGIIGLLLVYGIIQVANSMVDFTFMLSVNNIILGLSISASIGLISGIFPAMAAARMNPVEAIRK